jgi:hypothetical protein
MFVHKNHAAGGENGSIMVGMFVFLCLASPKPSEWEFFVPARTDLGVKLLTQINVCVQTYRDRDEEFSGKGNRNNRFAYSYTLRLMEFRWHGLKSVYGDNPLPVPPLRVAPPPIKN